MRIGSHRAGELLEDHGDVGRLDDLHAVALLGRGEPPKGRARPGAPELLDSNEARRCPFVSASLLLRLDGPEGCRAVPVDDVRELSIPGDDGVEDGCGAVDDRVFVVAGGEPASLLDLAVVALDWSGPRKLDSESKSYGLGRASWRYSLGLR